ncbi:MAG: beta-lactamase family protein [Firmicutes bacterium]|nr:beta-lactamase family protein [Bacillota bacterium]
MNKNIEEIQGLFERHFIRSKNSSMSIGITKGTDVFKYHLSKNGNEPVELYGLGSVSKTIIATYLVKMSKQGKINLNHSINKYLDLNPKIKYPTINQLATHTSGYHAFIPLFQSTKVLILKGFNKKNIYSKLDTNWLDKDLNRRRALKYKKYRYSDYNYAVIAMVIEKVENKPYKEVIEAFLREEIGMKQTKYGNETLTKDLKYSWYWEEDNPFLASGGLFSTVDDMMIFLKYQIDHCDELYKAHKMHIKINSKKNIFSAYSWNAFYSGSFYWHIGGQGYYRSYVLFDLKRDITVTLLATVDIDLIHVGRIGSCLYRNMKRNHHSVTEFLDELIEKHNFSEA